MPAKSARHSMDWPYSLSWKKQMRLVHFSLIHILTKVFPPNDSNKTLLQERCHVTYSRGRR